MRLSWVELRDFRNHRETRLDVPDGVVVAVGPNGEGKTNLLEGMHYLLDLASPRVGSDLPLVRHGAQSGYVRGEVETMGGRVLVEVEVRAAGANRVQVNRSPVRRKRDLRGRVRGVFAGPDDLAIGQGDPDRRRRFVDEAVAALWPARDTLPRAYEKALRQRNRLLRDWEGAPGQAPAAIEAWDAELVETGSALTRARAEAVARIRPPAAEEFLALTRHELRVSYRPSVPVDPSAPDGLEPGRVEEAFRGRLAERRGDELVRRSTLVGPHRDELELSLRDLTVRAFASHGESWAAAIALRLGLSSAVAEALGEPPVTFLDDPFSALDPERRHRLEGRLAGRGQVVVSVADEGQVPASAAAVWDVRGGVVTPRAGGEGRRAVQ
ncbi:MAG: DNA replication and repair protein RecF [Actinobacteria bacterium]|nr:DNA replication and repair protein RecF [Actinomycetota bacterium]